MKSLLTRLGAGAAQSGGAPWYIDIFLAFGGWIAGLLAAFAIFSLGFAVFASGGVGVAWFVLVAGIVFIAAGLAFARGGGVFRRQFSVAVVGAGLTAFAGGLTWIFVEALGDTQHEVGGSLLAASAAHALVAAFAARRLDDRILTFLATLAWFGLAAAGVLLLSKDAGASAPLGLFASLCAAAGAALFVGIGERRLPALGAALLTAPIIAGEALRPALSLGLAIGPGSETLRLASEAVYAVAILFCLVRLRSRAPLAALFACGAVLLASVYLLPNSGAATALALVAGMAAGSRALAAVGVVALAAFVSRYYYDLSLPLLEKSALLGGLGVATIAVAEGLRRFAQRRASEPRAAATQNHAERRSMVAALLFGALLFGATLLVNRSVLQLETDFRQARTIYLPLAPRDPRSILQGDYMALAFDPALFPPEGAKAEQAGEVFLALDARGIARFSRLAAPGDAPATDEIRVDYRRSGASLLYCPDTFFFQEGEADLFAAARFAVLKVAPDGKTRLVALADETLKAIAPEQTRPPAARAE